MLNSTRCLHRTAGLLMLMLAVVVCPRTARAQGAEAKYRVEIPVQLAGSTAQREALRVHALLQAEYPVYLSGEATVASILVGDFPSLQPARRLVGRLRSLGVARAHLARVRDGARLALEPGAIPPDTESRMADATVEIGPPAIRRARTPVSSASSSADSWQPQGLPGERRFDAASLSETPAPRARTLPPARPEETNGGEDPATDVDATLPVSSDVPQARAIRAPGPVRLDGQLGEDEWGGVRWLTRFEQKGRDRGFEPWDSTRVGFIYDDEALYVGARMWVGNPAHIDPQVSGRDAEDSRAERLLISLDTYRDRQTAYTFGVTMGGTRIDYQHARDNEGWRDASFDPVWNASVKVDDQGWTAELRIPFAQLPYLTGSDPVWGLNVRRWNPTTFLNAYWVVIPHYETGWSSRFGVLTGLPQLGAPRRVEVTPYVRAGATLPDSRLQEQGAERQMDYRAGADIEVGLAPNLALNATLNPDFGQVEADPAQVNLTQFETFFPEKRPFFLEGRQLFQARGPTWFYSRRVGSVPPGTLPAGGLEDPREASILGAAKLTGRLPSGLSVGGLAAVTDQERVGLAGFETAPDSTPITAAVAPTTAFVVGRVHQEIGDSGSGVGFNLTGVDRFFSDESDLGSLLTRTALAGGADWNARFGDGRFEVEGFAGLSHVAGEADAILRQQRSSARYYQRPDADHVALDSAATTLTGYTGGLSVAKIGGANLFWRAGVSAASPGFEIRDAGSQTRGDRVDAHASIRYGQRGNPGAVHTYSVGAAVNSGWNFGGTRRYTMPSLFADITWRSLIRSFVQVDLSTRALSDDLTRGGPLMGTGLGGGLQLNLSSSPVPTTQWYANGRAFFDEFGGWSTSVDGGVALRPSERFGISFGPGLTRSLDSRQYFGTFDGGGPDTFGSRYVFAYLSRTELFAQLRMDYAVTPELTIELYAEPFASSGDFQRFGELEEAGGSQVREYGEDGVSSVTEAEDGTVTVTDGAEQFQLFNSDFRVRSFRSNAVVRWEWAPGSTFHLIWQQSRFQFDEFGTPPDAGSLFRTFGDPGESILVAKLSYWFSF